MKVLHVCETLLGGTGTYLNELLPAMQKEMGDSEIFILAPENHKEAIPDIKKSVFWFSRPTRKLGIFNLAKEYIRVMRKIRPDIVHAHSTFAGFIVRLLSPFFRAKVIYCPHGFATNMKQSKLQKSIIVIVEKILSFFCSKIICISNHEKQVGLDIGISESKLVTIYNGISKTPPKFTLVPWEDTRLKLLFVGRFDTQKGIDILLEAVSDMENNVVLYVIGGSVISGNEIDFSKYKNVKALGWRTSSEIAAYMSASDAVVIPSLWEGFGLVAIEAMRVSKPVIASRVGGLAEIVIDKETGFLIPPDDATALARCISSVNKKDLIKIGNNGKNRFLSKFTSDRMILEIIDMYKIVVKN